MRKFAASLVLVVSCGKAAPSVPADAASSSADAAPSASTPVQAATALMTPPTRLEVKFSPKGGCTEMVVGLIASSKRTVRVMAYGFTSQPIATALVDAQKRGVDVQVVLDKSNLTETSSKMSAVTAGGVHAFVDSKHQIMHDKVVIVDGTSLETGSFNYTAAAEERNAENCLVVHNPSVAKQYGDEWQAHRDHSGLAP